jgi:D-alanyl-lipoteichoic acid acyltransferase DltB (MBOAT superfamily)
MLFNSYGFIFFYLPVAFFGFFWIARNSHRMAALWLAVASLFFYGWWNPKFVLLLLGSISFNYAMGYAVGHARTSREKVVVAKRLLVVALAVNLALLGYFKYTNFFITTANQLADTGWSLTGIILPLGISFFTFTQIAFLVDTYRGIAHEYSFIHYLLFVSWFPHLIAGPVLHHKQMMPQFALPTTYRPNTESISIGLTLFSLGLFKKVVLADQFALYANPIFSTAEQGGHLMLFEAWLGALTYTLQLYFDFSGYSDMAIGLSRLFNIKLPLNFDSPYKAANIIDFWRRWHMTLSAFLRDYLYIALGGNRKGPVRRYINLLATMLLGGLWHGAGWNFVLWGGLHGSYLVVNHGWRKLYGRDVAVSGRLARLAAVLFTFTAVVIAWVPFRATNFAAALVMLKGMAGLNGVSLPSQLEPYLASVSGNAAIFSGLQPGGSLRDAVIWSSIGLSIIWFLPNTQQWLANFAPAWDAVTSRSRFAWQPTRRHAVLVGALFTLSLLVLNRVSEFLYFQF